VSLVIEMAGDLDAVAFARERLGFEPDEKQAELLATTAQQVILNCSRQWGKSTVSAARAVYEAWSKPGSLTLVVSPSERQSGEFVRKARAFAARIESEVRGDGQNRCSVMLTNGSRIVGVLNGGVTEGKLDLFEGGVAFVGEFGEGSSQVVGRNFYSQPPAVLFDYLEHRLSGHGGAGDAVALVDGAEEEALGNRGRGDPLVDRELGPGRHGYRANPFSLAGEVDEQPAGVAQLDAIDRKQGELLAAEAAAEEQTQKHPVAFSLVQSPVGEGEQLFGLNQGQPVAGAGAVAFRARDAADRTGEFAGGETVVGGLAHQFADGAEGNVDRGGGLAARFEGRPVLLDGRLVEAGRAPVPGPEAGTPIPKDRSHRRCRERSRSDAVGTPAGFSNGSPGENY
jgi:hypothetical protein